MVRWKSTVHGGFFSSVGCRLPGPFVSFGCRLPKCTSHDLIYMDLRKLMAMSIARRFVASGLPIAGRLAASGLPVARCFVALGLPVAGRFAAFGLPIAQRANRAGKGGGMALFWHQNCKPQFKRKRKAEKKGPQAQAICNSTGNRQPNVDKSSGTGQRGGGMALDANHWIRPLGSCKCQPGPVTWVQQDPSPKIPSAQAPKRPSAKRVPNQKG